MSLHLRKCLLILFRGALVTMLGLGLCGAMIASATSLADRPVFSTSSVAGNLALALSVEFPTVSRVAHVADYSSARRFLGYFDPEKCYVYQRNPAANGVTDPASLQGDSSFFDPIGPANNRTCQGQWSGNFLNWASLTAIDPFRWAMTGGRRVVDTVTDTIIEKGRNAGQGYFPIRDQTARTEGRLPIEQVAGATPFSTATAMSLDVNGWGFGMRISTNAPAARTMVGSYFNNRTLSGIPAVIVSRDSVFHDWGNGSPAAGINANDFSARYEGTFIAPESGNYVFRTRSDDGVRVNVAPRGAAFATCNGNVLPIDNCVINNWADHGPAINDSAPIWMNAGDTYAVRIEYHESTGGAVMQFQWRRPSEAVFSAFSDDFRAQTYTMRVRVCKPEAGLEPNCKAYGTNYKPEGLIQRYSDTMRFSAFGYLNDDSELRDGAVLRASQKFVGPNLPVPGRAPEVNDAREWNAATGIMVSNPDEKTDAKETTGIQDSGVMNYLNKFGQLMPGTYKGFDPVNELFYATLRYYRNLGNVPEWSVLTTAASPAVRQKWVDGFPVVQNWKDPVQYTCQPNFVLGIGDIYTHRDKNVPGNTLTAHEPDLPQKVSEDGEFNALTATNKVKSLQGLGEGTATAATGSGFSTDYMAGLAYDANTKDIRPDLADKQTVQTYWVDVLEAPFVANNKFYMAAKFGGLNAKNLPADFNPDQASAANIPDSAWTTTGDLLPGNVKRPDNYFTAGQPDTMVAGLQQAFERISRQIGDYATSFAFSAVQIQSVGAASYGAQYSAKDWTGIITASKLDFNADGGVPTATQAWATDKTLEAQLAGDGWNANRRVVTWNGTGGKPFRLNELTAAQTSDSAGLGRVTAYGLGSTVSTYVNYLRGDRSNEKTTDTDNSKPYRKRPLLLGDVVNSKVVPVGPPAKTFSEVLNPGYTAFKRAGASRRTMVYVGANDGMLHAFDGSLTGPSGGQELFAYIPSMLFAGPTNAPQTDGLAQLGNPVYQHRNYVDASPKIFDMDFRRTVGDSGTATSDWRSVLIGGLGKGGRGFYAIDVTNPASMGDEAAVAQKVLWEFTDSTMGFSFGAANVVKTQKHGWVVVLTSGYNNSGGAGYGYIYIVNPRNGQLIERIRTAGASNGLAHASAYVQDFSDGTVDAVYAGDLNGQLWRFDLTGSPDQYSQGVKLAVATAGSGNSQSQPITTAPLIEIQPTSRKRFVLFGTGQLLDTADIDSTRLETFYGIVDGTASRFAPASNALPVTRASLTNVTDNLKSATLDSTSRGWFIDLGVDEKGGTAWRLVDSPTTFNGIVAFAPLLTDRNPCSPSGVSRLYALDFGTGQSVLTTKDSNNVVSLISYIDFGKALTDVKIVKVDETVRIVTSDIARNKTLPPFRTPAAQGVRMLNWREVPALE